MSCENCSCNDEANIVNIIGARGLAGVNGWTPLVALVSDSARRVLQITGWTGGSGNQPPYTNQYIGPIGIVAAIGDAVDIRGAIGITGDTGEAGDTGWSPLFAIVSDGERRVLQIIDWTGGTGTEPSTTNQFIGAVGIVSSAAAAVDIRGAAGVDGAQGEQGIPGVDVADGRVKISNDDTTLGYISDKIVSSDSTVSVTEVSPGGNEQYSLSTKSVADDQYSFATQYAGTSYVDVFTYTTPNDAWTRKYNLTFSCVGTIAIDGLARSSQLFIGLYINGVLIKEKIISLFGKSGAAVADSELIIHYAGAVLPNQAITIKVKTASNTPADNTISIYCKSLSISGIL
jgi:hypothetical protein